MLSPTGQQTGGILVLNWISFSPFMVEMEIPSETLEGRVIEPIPRITIVAAKVELELVRRDPRFADDTSPPIYHVAVLFSQPDATYTKVPYTLFTSPSEATARAAYETATAQLRDGYAVRVTGINAAELVKPDK